MNKVIRKILRKVKKYFVKPLPPIDWEEKKKQDDFDYLIANGVETEYGYVTLRGLPIIQKHPYSRIIIGKDVVLVSESSYNVAGINHPIILSTQSEGAEIIIGDGTGMSGTSVVAVNKIIIGKKAKLGANTNVFDTDFHPLNSEQRKGQKSIIEGKSAPVVLGDNVWMGINSTVLKGVVIGNNAVIGAHSLVIKNVPPLELHAGVPALYIKKLD